jgi:Flp pilus assembly protein TadD
VTAKSTLLALLAIAVAGCATAPGPDAPDASATPRAAPTSSAAETFEQQHRERAQQYTRDRNWADALVQWELLALLRPDSREYRDAAEDARKRIRDGAAALLNLAAQAQRQGNLDQATLLYLRVLNMDRDNATAAQALRDIDHERNRRQYYNRAPRMAM